jgi:hypothetical protein
MNATDPAVLEAIRNEYVTGADRPSLEALAERHTIGYTTLKRACAAQRWVYLRNGYWTQLAREGTSQSKAVAGVAVALEEESRERSGEILRFVRDGLTKALQEAIRRLVTSKGMSDADAAKVVARWEDMAAKDITRFLAQGPQALSSVVKTLELVEGRPTDRVAFIEEDIPVTDEEELAVAGLLKRARDMYPDE